MVAILSGDTSWTESTLTLRTMMSRIGSFFKISTLQRRTVWLTRLSRLSRNIRPY